MQSRTRWLALGCLTLVWVGCARRTDTYVYVKSASRVGVTDTTRGANQTILAPDGEASARGSFTRARIDIVREANTLTLRDPSAWILVDTDGALPRSGHRRSELIVGDQVRVAAERLVSRSDFADHYVKFDIVTPLDNVDRIVEKRRPASRGPAYLYIPVGLLGILGGAKFVGNDGVLGYTGAGLLTAGIGLTALGLWYGFWPETTDTWTP